MYDAQEEEKREFASNEWPSLPRGGGGVVSKEGQDKVWQGKVKYGKLY